MLVHQNLKWAIRYAWTSTRWFLKRVKHQIGPPRFTIVKIQRTNPVIIYILEDYRGKSVAWAFYKHELHRATHPDVYLMEKVLRWKGDKVYVKWLYSMDHNSWIHKNNVIWYNFDSCIFISIYKKYINIFFFIILSIFVLKYTYKCTIHEMKNNSNINGTT